MQYIDILGPKGNAFALMAEAKNLGKQIGLDKEEIEDEEEEELEEEDEEDEVLYKNN